MTCRPQLSPFTMLVLKIKQQQERLPTESSHWSLLGPSCRSCIYPLALGAEGGRTARLSARGKDSAPLQLGLCSLGSCGSWLCR